MRTKSLLISAIILLTSSLFAQDKTMYHRAKIFYSNPSEALILSSLGLEMDHGNHKKNVFLESDFSVEEITRAEEAGFNTEIVIKDVQKYYIEKNKQAIAHGLDKNLSCIDAGVNTYVTPDNFELGSMGGFFTYDEILAELDDMADQYPNPNVDQDKPEMLYDAIHHAREPASVSTLIYYMWYLLENYETNPEVQSILDNSELYFVPVINPDGYVYNVTNSPDGGGLWRKNRRDHENGDFGVDNNRNYGIEWGTNGISFNTNSDIYCGEESFSEAENQAMKWMCENHEFLITFNNHSYSNLLLYPFGFATDQLTDEHDIFMDISEEMVSQNGYTNQLGADLYPASGNADDWMYVETSEKGRIFSFTPEIGSPSQGFWPTAPEIIPLANSIMYMNLTAAHMITKYANIEDLTPDMTQDLSGDISFNLKRLGLQASDFSVEVVPVSNNITFSADAVVFSGLDLLQSSSASMPYTLNTDIADGEVVQYRYSIDNGDYVQQSTIYEMTYGAQSSIFSDDGTEVDSWNNGDWSTTSEDFVSSPSSITDSPGGEYQDNAFNLITLDEEVSLLDANSANLTFQAKWQIEAGWDYAQVLVSTDGGSSWIPQCGQHTVIGNQNQAEDEPLYDGNSDGWVEESISLSD